MRFLDTNIVLYSISQGQLEKTKRRIAEELLKRRDLAISVQVLQEFYTQATRENRTHKLTHKQAVDFMTGISRYKVQDLTLYILNQALSIKSIYGFSYWDCAIVAAAKELQCDTIYTEDLQHNQLVEGMRIINPFVE